MKKGFKFLIVIGIMLLTLTGCTKSKAYTFKVDTGDKIKVELNITDGYDLSSSLPFTISKEGNELSQGTFMTIDSYDEYVSAAKTSSLAKVIEEKSNNNIEYIFYSYNSSEYNYIIKVKDSKTGILLGNPHTQEEAEKCFKLLTFSLEK